MVGGVGGCGFLSPFFVEKGKEFTVFSSPSTVRTVHVYIYMYSVLELQLLITTLSPLPSLRVLPW